MLPGSASKYLGTKSRELVSSLAEYEHLRCTEEAVYLHLDLKYICGLELYGQILEDHEDHEELRRNDGKEENKCHVVEPVTRDLPLFPFAAEPRLKMGRGLPNSGDTPAASPAKSQACTFLLQGCHKLGRQKNVIQKPFGGEKQTW